MLLFGDAYDTPTNLGETTPRVNPTRTNNRLIRNEFTGTNRWLKVELTSPQGQAGTFGAEVRVYLAGTSTLLGVREARGAYGYVAQDEPLLDHGLRAATTVDLEITFPDGAERRVQDVSTNRLVSVGP